MDDRESILGLDNIRLDLPLAGVGSRTLAATIDYLILGVLVLLWVIAWTVSLSLVGSWAFVLLFAGIFLLEYGYFAASEILSGGRTLGKRVLKIRVITAEGGTPSKGALLTRNLVRSLDLVFGIPLMAIDPQSRRLGDRLAGTLVAHERRAEAVPFIGRVPPGWGPRELAVVEAFVARSHGFDATFRTHEMAERILERLRREAPALLEGVDTRDPVEAIRRALQVEMH